jgi:hypothetical protein
MEPRPRASAPILADNRRVPSLLATVLAVVLAVDSDLPPGTPPLTEANTKLLIAVAGGASLFDSKRDELRAALGPETARAIGLDHPGFPSPCERAVAAAYYEEELRTMVGELDAVEKQAHDQEVQWAASMVPAEGIRFRDGRVLRGDSAVRWILAHPGDFDPELAHRQVLKTQARASLTKVLRKAGADARAAKRACRVGR